ncbi:MAG: mevalonate kinase [Sandaracinaceae bacterium]
MVKGFGKVILLGEHAVVYGRPALAAALARGVDARWSSSASPRLRIAPWRVDVGPGGSTELARAFRALLGGDAPAVTVDATVELPAGAGLGCSAALGVAVLRALDEAAGREADDEDVAERSLAWERVFHGNPSGVDSALAAAGGVRVFRRGERLATVSVGARLPLVIGHSGEPGSTKATVAEVARRHAADREGTERTFDAIAALVESGRRAVGDGALPALGRAMNENHAHLRALGVSTDRLDALTDVARQAGALGAKLTGGGGGGCMVALAAGRDRAESIRRALAAEGSDAFLAEVAAGRVA